MKLSRDAILKRLASIKAEAKSIVDAADKDGGKLTEAQESLFDALMDEREKLEAAIKRLDAIDSMDASLGRLSEPGIPQAPEAKPAPRIELGRERAEDDPMRGFASAADFGLSVMRASAPGGQHDKRLARLVGENDGEFLSAPSNFHRETGSADGYMVPPAVREEVWGMVFSGEGILDAVMPEPTSSNAVQIIADESTPWGSTGVQAKWASEGSQFTPSRLETKGRLVQLHKLYAFVTATDELIEDAPRLNNRLTAGAARAIKWKAEDAIVNGDGVGKPLGWFKAAALVSVAKESGQTADTLNEKNVLKMFARHLSEGSDGSFWLAHKSTLPQLAQMAIGNQPMFTPPQSGLREAPQARLLGLPIVWSEHAETLGDKGDIQLVSPRGYYATTKVGGVKFDASIHLYFDYGLQAFRWTFRLGGQPYLSAAVSRAKGNDTLSHFVTLDERA